MKQGKIDVYEGTGRILGPSIFSPLPGTISVEMNNGMKMKCSFRKMLLLQQVQDPKLPGIGSRW